jgi:hypothetical protein
MDRYPEFNLLFLKNSIEFGVAYEQATRRILKEKLIK